MKKTVAILAVLLVVGFCAFAEGRLSFALNPMTFQSIIKNGTEKEYIHSKNGIGCELDYDWTFDGGFSVGGSLGAGTYFFEEKTDLVDINILAKAGYFGKVSPSVGVFGYGKVGGDIQIHGNLISAVLTIGAELGIEFQINEHFNFLIGCEGLFGFPEKAGVNYTEIKVNPCIGVDYAF